MTVLIPMAGEGKRFQEAGYKLSKPLIPVSGKPMVIQALDMLPKIKDEKAIFICRDFHLEANVDKEIQKYYKNSEFISIDYLTEGQACTCLLAKNKINNDEELIIGACDNGFVYNKEQLEKAKAENDVLVFSFRNNEAVKANPNQYGWIVVDEKNKALKMSVKKAISENPMNDHSVVGAFWFKKGRYFVESAEEMIKQNIRINNEFYVDKCIDNAINASLKVSVFEVEEFICWGTPEDLEKFEKEKRKL